VDADLHAQVLKRSEALGIAPYGGFINPRMQAERDANGAITKVTLTYPDSFAGQMLDYAKNYHFLTPENK
jgi:dipeptidyl-peptidase-3